MNELILARSYYEHFKATGNITSYAMFMNFKSVYKFNKMKDQLVRVLC